MLETPGVEGRRVAARHDSSERIAVVGLRAPRHLRLVLLGYRMEQLENAGGTTHKDGQEPVRERVERSAMADRQPGLATPRLRQERLHQGEAGRPGGLVQQVDARVERDHWAFRSITPGRFHPG